MKDTVTVVAPNGVTEAMDYHPNQKVRVLLEAAVKEFADQNLLSKDGDYLLVKGATPLPLELSLADAGVQPGDELKVRAKAIPSDGTGCTRS